MEIAGQSVYFKSSEHMDEIDSESVTLVVTSPPYWNVRDYGGEQIGFGQSYHEYIDSLNVVWTECLRVLQPNGKIAINVQPLPIPGASSGYDFRVICDIMHDIEAFFREHDCFLSGMIFWNKAAYVNNVSWGSYPKPTNIATNTSFEQIYTFVKRGDTRKVSKDVLDRSMLTKDEWRHWAVRCVWDDIVPVIKINSKGENLFGHGAPFPEDIPYRLIRMHTAEGETVLDPFLGSGTTLKITRLFKRKGIGYELNKDFEPLIRERVIEDWTSPPIESHYRPIGNATMAKILEIFRDTARSSETCDEDGDFYGEIIDALRRALPDLFSSAYLKNIKRNLGLLRENKDDNGVDPSS